MLYKTAKVFQQRGGLERCADNCDLIRQEVEGFKKFVPLVQVRAAQCTNRRPGVLQVPQRFPSEPLLREPLPLCTFRVLALPYR